ncbi:hypothetical protein A2419_00820 [Candidatus Adlerbacteria bacterium RIFOXYC1_FULL_48_26]|uniref:Succinylglutamate desuccinylase/Aspartoacylase catalytic domain-containing protein n=1 Tax=Candidatus Adlerbacteria bacterium RIFOXYC1_FULL_48_26 TaxID=1797247 RepID=A0A1F4Y1Z4_9BACT|nr:MAG: hypothetical protein A2419_00820 [Candidatus Adlerbacteria bacterium RIFOXYC1_FULL_48_26]OGC96450.1 MAG: hypothetical protein A2590_02855 [Candidatus Adlerbacteria bacterium RIFOXYD1_FULL_48_8]
MEEVLELVGKEDGPTSMVLVGVHGDETCGVEALKALFPSLVIARGRVFVGYGNPPAISARKRFLERNLNRMFVSDDTLSPEDMESYEYKRAQYLKPYLQKSGAVLDVHANPWKEKQTFVICESNATDIANFLPTNLLVSGFDAVEPGGADYYMNSIGKIGICFECGYLDDEYSRKTAGEAMMAFLKARGHIENDIVPEVQSRVHIFYKGHAKTNNFKLSRQFTNFERITKGEIIGMDGGEAVVAPKDCLILFARNGYIPGADVFLLGEVLP